MWSLHRQGMRSLVLDLRGNPGGLLDESIDICNLFLPSGRIVATRGRNASDNMDESATWSRTWSTPLVVLVDGDSASASEIFAAAVQENGRGVIVGRKTYGKGTVQTHFPLRTVSGELKLTTAKFYSPRGREMAGRRRDPGLRRERRFGVLQRSADGRPGRDGRPAVDRERRRRPVGDRRRPAPEVRMCRSWSPDTFCNRAPDCSPAAGALSIAQDFCVSRSWPVDSDQGGSHSLRCRLVVRCVSSAWLGVTCRCVTMAGRTQVPASRPGRIRARTR